MSVLLLVFVPGFLILRSLTRLREEELIASSPGVSFLILGTIVFLGNLFDGNQFAFSVALLAGMLFVVLGLVIWRRPEPPKARSMLGLFLLFFLHLLAFQLLLPIYAGGAWYGDWWENYSISQVYLYHGDYHTIWFGHFNLLTRTPLFNLVASFFLSIFGDHFWVFQIAASVMNSVFVLPLYLLTKRVFGRKTGMLAVTFLIFNTWAMHNAWYTWPKMLNSYFILLSVHYYLEFKETHSASNLHLLALFNALAFMSHQLAILYTLGLAIDYLLRRPRIQEGIEHIVKFSIVSIAIIAPWYLWAIFIFGAKSLLSSTPTAIAMTGYRSPQGVLRVLFSNAHQSVIPLPLFREANYSNLISLYYNPIIGAITITLGAYLLYFVTRHDVPKALKSMEAESEHFTMVLLVIVGYFGALLVQLEVSERGIAHNTMVPLVLILLIYLARLLELAGREVVLLFSGIVLEFGVSTWYQVHRLIAGQGFDKIAENNLALKSSGGLVFLRDYMGGSWLPPVLLAVSVEIIALYMVYICNIRGENASLK